MKIERHGLSIGLERIDNSVYLTLKAVGKLIHEDYELITPMIDSALEGLTDPKICALVDGTELDGWAPRAAWDDFKLGIKHRREFAKVAIYGNKRWQEMGAKVGSWFIAGDIRYFDDESAALAWLRQPLS